jgi:hypothetical protein
LGDGVGFSISLLQVRGELLIVHASAIVRWKVARSAVDSDRLVLLDQLGLSFGLVDHTARVVALAESNSRLVKLQAVVLSVRCLLADRILRKRRRSGSPLRGAGQCKNNGLGVHAGQKTIVRTMQVANVAIWI